jgi:transposase InsO family protein
MTGHHPNRGSQYSGFAMGHRLREAGTLSSMGSTGGALRQAALAESFFGTLECELLSTFHGTRSTAAILTNHTSRFLALHD